ncbi:ATP-binding protein [Desulfobacter curvatus]|uniref:ATP-binding protein n=1 Tax=Desulfobacter curvatus TaxID=2290 RepID=UPI00036A255C|nr:ATP-binding protein [Desulfobacter curvatus]
MKKEYLIIPLVFVLISAIVAGYNVHVIVDVQKRHIFELLSHQVNIGSWNLQEFADEFEKDFQYALTTIPFHELLSRETLDYDLTNQVRRFYSKYQNILSSIQVFNRSTCRELYNSEGNYFFISEIRKNDSSRVVVDGNVCRLEKDTLHYLSDIRKDGKKVGAIEIRMDFPRIIYNELRKSHISREFWPWCVDADGRVIIFLADQRVVPESERQVDGIKSIVDDIADNYLGEQIHTISLNGEKKQVFSAYYPIRIFGEQVGVVFSVSEDEWLAGVKTKMAAVIGSFLLIIILVIAVFLFIIWQRVAAELELKKSEATITKILQNIQAGVLIIDREQHTIEFANELAANMAGRAVEDLIGESCHYLVCPNEKGACPVTDKGEEIDKSERVLLTAGGEQRDILKTVIPLEYEGRESLLETFVDITDLKKQTALAQALAEKAAAASRAKSEFLANMSHEFRTPMNHIIGMSHLVLDTELTSKQRSFLKKISDAAGALMSILNSVLDYSKIDIGKMEVKRAAFQFSKIMSDVKDHILSQSLGQKKLNVLFDIDSKIPEFLFGDGPKLKQVLLNLAENAVKFTDSGKVVIKALLEKELPQSVRLRFSVRDTGIGITADQLNTVFDAFTQSDTSNTRKYGGTGLGLAVSKRLVELMQGQLAVQSTPGTGSEFSFSLSFDVEPAAVKNKAPDVDRGLDLQDALARLGGDQTLLEKVLLKFYENHQNDMETINAALTEGDRETAGHIVHKLKGSAGMIGALELSTSIVALEAALKDGDEQLENHLKRVSSGMSDVLSAIGGRFEDSPFDKTEEINSPIDVDTVLPLLKSFEAYLKESDLEAMGKLDEIKIALKGTSVMGALEKVEKQLNQYDFEAALSAHHEVLSVMERYSHGRSDQ